MKHKLKSFDSHFLRCAAVAAVLTPELSSTHTREGEEIDSLYIISLTAQRSASSFRPGSSPSCIVKERARADRSPSSRPSVYYTRAPFSVYSV